MKFSPDVVRILQTVNTNLCVFCMGLYFSAHGTVLLDLAEVYATSVEVVSYSLTTRAAGSIIAGLFGGTLFRHINSQLVIMVSVLLCGIAVILIPAWPNIVFLHMISLTLGCASTLCEIGGNVWLQIIWKDRSGPVLQTYHLIFGVGGIVAPFICEPFLNKRASSPIDPSNVNLITATNISSEIEQSNQTMTFSPESASRIHIAYGILGSIFLFNFLSYLVSYKLDSTDLKPDESPETIKNRLPKRSEYIIVILLATYMLLGVADEITLTSFLPTFVVRNPHLKFTKSEAAYLSSAFWLSYTLSRLLSTILSFKLTPGKMIVFFHTILMTATVGMLAFMNTSKVFAWTGSILVSFGLSPYFGNVFIWGVQYILLGHTYMSILMVCICVGAMVPSALIGRVIDAQPMVMLWSHAGLATALTLCAVVLLVYGKTGRLREHEQKMLEKKNEEMSTNSTYPL